MNASICSITSFPYSLYGSNSSGACLFYHLGFFYSEYAKASAFLVFSVQSNLSNCYIQRRSSFKTPSLAKNGTCPTSFTSVTQGCGPRRSRTSTIPLQQLRIENGAICRNTTSFHRIHNPSREDLVGDDTYRLGSGFLIQLVGH